VWAVQHSLTHARTPSRKANERTFSHVVHSTMPSMPVNSEASRNVVFGFFVVTLGNKAAVNTVITTRFHPRITVKGRAKIYRCERV
jgi:hypothetical protein